MSFFEDSMVVIDGVRYRREEAKSLGLKTPEEVVAELAAAELATIKASEDQGVSSGDTAAALTYEQTLKQSAAAHIEADRVATSEAAAAPLPEEEAPDAKPTASSDDAVADPTEGVALPAAKATTVSNKSRASSSK